jgi:integrase
MAGQLFKRYSGGKTLHQLRHSRLTHLGDQNVSAPLLMAISGHKRLATLQRYVKAQPGRRRRPDGRQRPRQPRPLTGAWPQGSHPALPSD